MWTKRLKLTQLAQCTLPVGSLRVNLIDTATHVVPTAEYWRTGVQIPPAPPNQEEDALGRLFLCLKSCENRGFRSIGVLRDPTPSINSGNPSLPLVFFWNTHSTPWMPNSSKLLNLNDIHPVSEKRINMGLGLFLRWAWLKRESGLWNRCSGVGPKRGARRRSANTKSDH